MSVSEALAIIAEPARSALQPEQFVVPMATLGSPGLSFLGKPL
jgi:hypothetical protein